MGMTKLEQAAKDEIIKKLRSEGYTTYSHLLDLFDVNLTNDPNVVAYMVPDQGVIVINRNLDIDQISTIVRHEILHEYLAHKLRMEKHIGSDKYAKRSPAMHQIMNIAGDYEISNKGYTDRDKDIARAIKLNDQTLKGLVTEDDHPDWYDPNTGEGKSFEEMYDLLTKEYEKDKEKFEKAIEQYMKDLQDQLGDSDIQKAEQIERDAQIAQEAAEDAAEQGNPSNSSAGSGSKSDSDKDKEGEERAKAIKKAAGELKKDMEKELNQGNKTGSKHGGPSDQESGSVFADPEALEKQKKLKIRLDKIEKAFKDLLDKNDLIDEVDAHKNIDRAAKAERDMNQYRADPTRMFQASLQDFVKRILGIERGPSWSRPNRRYAGTGIYVQGKSIKQKPIPVIHMYFDQSGSWSDNDIILGNKCVSVLNSYVRQGKIRLKLFYFSNYVHDNARDARREGGTSGQPIMDHIAETHPDNVIILTDSDISDITNKTKVPGAVWLLFRNGYRSNNLIDSIKGEKLTKIFDIRGEM